MKTTNEINKLQKQVQKRQSFLKTIVQLALELVQKVGSRIAYDQSGYHTHTVSELKDFNAFSFRADLGHGMMGGNDLKISFRSKPVLDIYWQCMNFDPEDKGCRVDLFDESPNWQEALLDIGKNKECCIAQFKLAQEPSRDEITKRQLQLQLNELKLLAKRLGLK